MAIEAIAKENETIGFQNNTQIVLLQKIPLVVLVDDALRDLHLEKGLSKDIVSKYCVIYKARDTEGDKEKVKRQ